MEPPFAVQVQIQLITPTLAAEWLAGNVHNRNMRKGTVRRLREAIHRGEWLLNGETIKFSEDGFLLDGQHRLRAVVDAETAVWSIVVTGLRRGRPRDHRPRHAPEAQ